MPQNPKKTYSFGGSCLIFQDRRQVPWGEVTRTDHLIHGDYPPSWRWGRFWGTWVSPFCAEAMESRRGFEHAERRGYPPLEFS